MKVVLLPLFLSSAFLLFPACDEGSGDGENSPTNSCPASEETPGGVGAPCQRTADCDKNPRLSCPTRGDGSGIDFCTMPCDYLTSDHEAECGPGATCSYVGAGGRCVPSSCAAELERAAPVSSDNPAGRVGTFGVGQACNSYLDCTGSYAKMCDKDTREGGFDFCTVDCAYSIENPHCEEGDLSLLCDPCGEGAECVYAGGGRGRCVPSALADTLALAPPSPVEVAVPCCVGEAINEQGIGVPCTDHTECQGNTGAQSCPIRIDPRLPNWCTHLCDFGDDDDCGPDAFCWWRPSIEGGMVGSCAPNRCRLDHPEVALCEEPADGEGEGQ